MHTEKEARQKWCPYARHITVFADDASVAVSSNRGPAEIKKQCCCIASDCMAFQWARDGHIALGNGSSAVIDDADRGLASLQKWWWDGRYVKGQASRSGKSAERFYLHRFIMKQMIAGPLPEDLFVDHIDGDPLNNRRGNLRLVTKQQNAVNAAARGGKSKYRGVSQQHGGRWMAQISSLGNRICLGTYDTEEEAAKAYDEAANAIHGEYARLNLTPVTNSGRLGFCGLASKP